MCVKIEIYMEMKFNLRRFFVVAGLQAVLTTAWVNEKMPSVQHVTVKEHSYAASEDIDGHIYRDKAAEMQRQRQTDRERATKIK